VSLWVFGWKSEVLRAAVFAVALLAALAGASSDLVWLVVADSGILVQDVAPVTRRDDVPRAVVQLVLVKVVNH
jgi:hypothetical protein